MDVYSDSAELLGTRLGALLDQLEGGQDRPRMVVLAGLNGISIGEHEGTLQDSTAFAWWDLLVNRTVHVPLAFIAEGGGETRTLQQPVELVDILPSLLAAAQATSPHDLPGQDLLSSSFQQDLSGESAYVEYGDMLALRHGDHLLSLRAMIHNSSSLDPYLTEVLQCPGFTEGYRLHDVVEDPVQARDLLEEEPALATELKDLLLERRLGPGAPPASLYEDDRLLQLRLTAAEGYW